MDYSRIRGGDLGPRLAFEELVCQLARREPQAPGSEFRRIEGAGGDGGVEAYWLLKDGSKIGYQAKFHLKSGDINWVKIDDSVSQALKTHSSLTKYIVAIPCDLTDRTGLKGNGKTGWQHWETHKAKWEALVPEDRHVEFILWSASCLTDRLGHPNAEGLKRYWFGDVEFSPKWFSEHVELAVTSLDERYHPEDHVEVGVERIFKVVLREQSIVDEIQESVERVCSQAAIEDSSGVLDASQLKKLSRVASGVKCLQELSSKFNTDAWSAWPVGECINCLRSMSDDIKPLQDFVWKIRESQSRSELSGNRKLVDLDRDLRDFSDACYSLRSLLNNSHIRNKHENGVFLSGRAGAGKSHLLGGVAERAISEGRVAILVLGQHFSSENVWSQITGRLGLVDTNPDCFLQALSAAAEVTGRRGMFLIDAINEGAGLTLWRNELAEFIGRIRKYKNLVLVFSCRTEYVPYVIPAKLKDDLSSYVVSGFETPAEQKRAARIYLGKRGISQPDTPWLSEEFVNPLFLRSACTALARLNIKRFPAGLIGAKQVFAFYLKSISMSLGVGRDGSEELVRPTNLALAAIAGEMARERRDGISLSRATAIVAESFQVYPAPPGTTWFEVLQRNGLFRYEQDFRVRGIDPFAVPEDIVQFSFQRLQDHLMVAALLEGVIDPAESLAGGVLQFIHDGKKLHGRWVGLADALSIQIPERFGRELLDVMPGEASFWANNYSLRDAFIESLKWRSSDSFTDRTSYIYNNFLNCDDQYLDVLIQVSANTEHPWNANLLHKRLLARKMPERDALWTVRLNWLSVDEGEAISRLIDWSAFEQNDKTDSEVQYLCALVLAWCLTSSNREIRDKATKALASLFLSNLDLYERLCEAFSSVDDLYVHERIHCAAYGACCNDKDEQRLRSYSAIAYRVVFDRNPVPSSILLRDAALGIVELAAFYDCLPENVDVNKAKPPYNSKMIRFSVTEKMLENTAERAGDSEILNSCSEWMGDFASYEIKPRVGSFLNVSLGKPEPISEAEVRSRFKEEVIETCAVRSAYINRMHRVSSGLFSALRARKKSARKAEPQEIDHTHEFEVLEQNLLKMLSKAEKARYLKEYQPVFKSTTSRPKLLPNIDAAAAQRWVAKRAYDLGWNDKLFSDDRSHSEDYGRSRPTIERIGKKYQWLALDELLCGLADNKWLSERRHNGSRLYGTPLNIGFHRDIDPTILLKEDDSKEDLEEYLTKNYGISLPRTEEFALGKWPFEEDPFRKIPGLVSRQDFSGRSWIVLHEHRSATERYAGKTGGEHGQRKQEWRFLLPVLVRSEDKTALVSCLRAKKSTSIDPWQTRDSTDEGFLLEAPWRSTWEQEQWQPQYFDEQNEVEIAYPCFRYHWESHLDASLPNGAHALLPAPWLTRRLGLAPHCERFSQYVDKLGCTRFVGGRSPDGGSYACIEQELFESLLEEDGLECVWVFAAERSAWPGGSNDDASWRRQDGVVWRENGKLEMAHWGNDSANGNSKCHIPTKRGRH